jgi:hypothetical protein
MFSHQPSGSSPAPLEAGETVIVELPGSCPRPGSHGLRPGRFTLTDRRLRFAALNSISSLVLTGVQRDAHEGEHETIDAGQITGIEPHRRMVLFRELLVTLRDGRVLHLGGSEQELGLAERALRERSSQP